MWNKAQSQARITRLERLPAHQIILCTIALRVIYSLTLWLVPHAAQGAMILRPSKKKRRKWNEEKEGISTRTSTFVKNRSWNYYDMCEFRQRIREKKVRRFFMWQYVQDKWKRLDEEVEIRLLFGFAKSTSEKSILGRLKRTKLQMHQIHLVKLWLANSFGSLQNWQWKEYFKKWKKNSKEWNTI